MSSFYSLGPVFLAVVLWNAARTICNYYLLISVITTCFHLVLNAASKRIATNFHLRPSHKRCVNLQFVYLSWHKKSKGKGKVDNSYCGSIIDPIAAEPLLQYLLVHWTHAIGCHIRARRHESPRKVPNYTAWWTEAHWCEQLAQGRCPTMQRPGVEPATSRSRVQQASHYTTKPPHGASKATWLTDSL